MSEVVNYSVKIDVEQRDLLQKKIAESQMTAGNFLSAMLASYEATQNRESLSDVREINQLRNHLARIEEIYISLAKSRRDTEENHEYALTDLKEQLTVAKAALVDVQKTAKTEGEALVKQMKELTEKSRKQDEENALQLADAKTQKEAAEESQRQTYKMATMAEQAFGQAQEQISTLQNDTALHKQRAEQAINELAKKTHELNTATQEILLLKTELQTEKEAALRALEDQQKHSEITTQKTLLAMQETALEKRENLQNEIVRLRDQLASERERIAQLSIVEAVDKKAII